MKRFLLIPLVVMFVSGLVFGGCAAPAPAPAPVPTPSPAPAPEPAKKLVFNFATFLPPNDVSWYTSEKYLQGLNEASGGIVEIKPQLLGAMGKPGDHYDLVRKGVADMAVFSPAYTPGQFPMVELMDLPMGNADAIQVSLAEAELLKRGYWAEDFKDIKILALYSVPALWFFWVDEPITTIEGMKGKKIRGSTAIRVKCMEAVGLIPVSMSVVEAYSALQKGIIEGEWLPPLISNLKLNEVLHHTAEFGMFYWTYVVGMNKDSFEKLPESGKKYLEDNFKKACETYGIAWEDICEKDKEMWRKDGNPKFYTFPETEKQKMAKLWTPIWEDEIAKKEAKGLPAKKALIELEQIFKELGVNDPFLGNIP